MKQMSCFIEVMWIHFMKFFSAPSYFSPLMIKYFLYTILEHPRTVYTHYCKRISFEESKITGKIIYLFVF